jgi:LmbE family N-acetylglucosaminyl deacetylase
VRLYPTIPTVGTILGVWAHPDDEAYLSAGLMALARQQGQRVYVVTATAGEAGIVRTATGEPASDPAGVRRCELAASLAALGVEEHEYLRLADGHCDEVDIAEGAELIGEFIDTVRPDTIVTFGPDGVTGHPDHLAVSAWTTAAWNARRSSARLWYGTVTPEFHHRWGAMNERLSLWDESGRRPCTPARRLAMEVQCRGDLLERKVAALHAHASQVAPLIEAMGPEAFAEWWRDECFVDAVPVRSAVLPDTRLSVAS